MSLLDEVRAIKRLPTPRADLDWMKEDDTCCEACGWKPTKLTRQALENWRGLIHSHHILPIACGGDDRPSNIAHLCPTCHAIGHKLGSIRRTYGHDEFHGWEGPTTREDLIAQIRTLLEPDVTETVTSPEVTVDA